MLTTLIECGKRRGLLLDCGGESGMGQWMEKYCEPDPNSSNSSMRKGNSDDEQKADGTNGK